MTSEQYWKLRAQLADHDLWLLRAQAEADMRQAARVKALTDAGLDPAVSYTLNDAACEAVGPTPKADSVPPDQEPMP